MPERSCRGGEGVNAAKGSGQDDNEKHCFFIVMVSATNHLADWAVIYDEILPCGQDDTACALRAGQDDTACALRAGQDGNVFHCPIYTPQCHGAPVRAIKHKLAAGSFLEAPSSAVWVCHGPLCPRIGWPPAACPGAASRKLVCGPGDRSIKAGSLAACVLTDLRATMRATHRFTLGELCSFSPHLILNSARR